MIDILWTFVFGYTMLNILGVIAGMTDIMVKDSFPIMDEIAEEGFMVKHIFYILLFLPCFLVVAVVGIVIAFLTFVFEKIIPVAKIHKLMNTRLFAKKTRSEK